MNICPSTFHFKKQTIVGIFEALCKPFLNCIAPSCPDVTPEFCENISLAFFPFSFYSLVQLFTFVYIW